MSKEVDVTDAATASSMFPGFRLDPSDEELILYYLKNKINRNEKAVEIIGKVDLCHVEPWDLPAKSVIKSNQEWFFFSCREKKYPRGSHCKRSTNAGYWKATGKARNVKLGSDIIGTKRTLVFHIGRSPKGEKTEWIMQEYCMNGEDLMVVCRIRRNIGFFGSSSENQEVPHPERLSLLENTYASDSEKPCSKEDVCFEDILNDDIIALDTPFMRSSLDIISKT